MAEKFLDKAGVKTLLVEIRNLFAAKTDIKDYDDDIASLNDSIAASAESINNSTDEKIATVNSRIDTVDEKVLSSKDIKELIKRTYDELEYGKYIVASSDDVENALANIVGTGSITLEDNVDLGSSILTIKEGVNLTLDLGGNELDIQSTSSTPGIYVNGGSLTIENGTINASKRALAAFEGGQIIIGDNAEVISGNVGISATGAGSKITMNSGSVTAQESGLLAVEGAKIEVNGGTITGLDNGPIMGNGTAGKGDIEIVMNGGELIANIQSAGYVAVGVYMPNSGTFTMNGGKITANGGAGVVCRGGTTTINGGEIVTTAHPTLEVGKVGDSRVVVPCSAIVYDKNSKYPDADNLSVIIGAEAVLNGAYEDITILSDEENPNVVDNRIVEETGE